jgi:hydrogenase maturation protease
MDGWEELRAPGPRTVTVSGLELGRGSRVVLRPRAGGDVLDRAVAGRVGVIEGVHQDMEGAIQLSVVLEDDPGRDLGELRQPGHRFFFSADELEPLSGQAAPPTRVLVAGIGNVFMADDGFGVEVARRLARRTFPAGVDVADFGIRGLDLVYALGDGYDAVVLVDALPRGEPPGTLSVIEPRPEPGEVMLDAHGMDPVKVLALARQLGDVPDRVLLVGCEPQVRMSGEEEDVIAELSEPVAAAVAEAVELVEELVRELTSERADEPRGGPRWAS